MDADSVFFFPQDVFNMTGKIHVELLASKLIRADFIRSSDEVGHQSLAQDDPPSDHKYI